MKRGVLKFTACCLAAGMTFSGMNTVAFASKDTTLAGFGKEAGEEQTLSIKEQMRAMQSEAPSAGETADQEDTSAETAASDETTASDSTAAETQQAEPAVDTSMSGQIAFAQCDEYINVRSSADGDSEVVGKVYNNGSVTILSQVGDWYEVQSGNAVGYVNSQFFAVGEEAQAIADEVAYNVATVYPEALTIRSEPSEDSESIGMAYSSDELEVVAYEGDWMKVALGGDVYGYVNAYYVGYDTYYPTAETLDEEQARLDDEWIEYLAQQEAEQKAAEQAYLDAIAADQAAQDQSYQQPEESYQQPEESWTAPEQTWTEPSGDAQAAADEAYQAYLDAQAAADAATQQPDEQLVYDTAADAQAKYQEYLNAQAQADAESVTQQQPPTIDDSYEAPSYDEPTYQEPSYDEPTYQEPSYDEPSYDEPSQDTSSSGSSLGSQIVNFATQFVGNPYVWGGTSLTNGADCSGFTQSVFANFGISIPRVAATQAGSGTPVDLGSIQPGDLLFYEGGSGIGHVTIYMGNGQVVHASNSTTGIIISDYGYRTPVSARRYW